MATGAMAAGGGAGDEERGPEGPPDNVHSSSPWLALLSVASSDDSDIPAPSPEIQRKPRSHVHRAAPSHPWGSKLPVLPPAPAKKRVKRKRTAKKRARPCALCGATETPLWRTLPTDRQVILCNACGIRVRTPGAELPELVHLHDLPPPAMAAATAVSEQEQPPPPAPEIQGSESPPDSPILESMLDVDVYLLRRTSPRRENVSPPPPPMEPAPAAAPPPPPMEPAAAAPALGNEKGNPVKCCLHCATTWSLQWRTGPAGEGTLCNPCGVRYRQGRLVPEYRPRASPTFNEAEHSYKHREVLRLRRMQDHPAAPAPFKPSRTRKRRKGKGNGKQQQPPAQIRWKRKGNNDKEPNQPAAQPATTVAVLQVRKKSKGKQQHRRTPQPAAAQHLPLPPPPLLMPHAGYERVHFLPLPPALLPHAGGDMEQHLPPPPALAHAGGELMMMGEPIPPPDPFLFDGPAAPRIIDDDDEPVIVIVIDDD